MNFGNLQQPEKPSYPTVQWVNDGGSFEPRRKSGGLFMEEPSEAVVAKLMAHAEEVSLIPRGKEPVAGIYIAKLTIVPLATRFYWVIKDGDRSTASLQYQKGARGVRQFLAVIGGELVVLSFKGLASKAVGQALKEGGFSYGKPWLATLTFSAGAVGKTRFDSVITTPSVAVAETSEEVLAKLAALEVDEEAVVAWRDEFRGHTTGTATNTNGGNRQPKAEAEAPAKTEAKAPAKTAVKAELSPADIAAAMANMSPEQIAAIAQQAGLV